MTDKEKYLEGFAPAVRFSTIKKFFVFPWSAFLFAEGDDHELLASFVTHTVKIKGDGLKMVLNAIQNQNLVWLESSERMEKLGRQAGDKDPFVSEIEVKPASK